MATHCPLKSGESALKPQQKESSFVRRTKYVLQVTVLYREPIRVRFQLDSYSDSDLRVVDLDWDWNLDVPSSSPFLVNILATIHQLVGTNCGSIVEPTRRRRTRRTRTRKRRRRRRTRRTRTTRRIRRRSSVLLPCHDPLNYIVNSAH